MLEKKKKKKKKKQKENIRWTTDNTYQNMFLQWHIDI